jgi:hypothetical protein
MNIYQLVRNLLDGGERHDNAISTSFPFLGLCSRSEALYCSHAVINGCNLYDRGTMNDADPHQFRGFVFNLFKHRVRNIYKVHIDEP